VTEDRHRLGWRWPLAFAASLSLHALVLTAAGWLTFHTSERAASRRPRPPAVTVFVVPPEDRRFPGLNPVEDTPDDWIRGDDLPDTLASADFTFEIARIVDRAEVLFPFVFPGLAWEHFILRPERRVITALANPYASSSAPGRERSRTPLRANAATLQQLVDQSWSRRHRWDAFEPIRGLIEKHDANAGELPVLLQRYCDQNALQLYSDSPMRDPRLWVQLGIVANHTDFIGLIRQYAAEHPSTRATTALLFLLDVLAQGSLEVLLTLLESDPSRDLQWTRRIDPRAHQLLARLRNHYRSELVRRGWTSAEAITVAYESVRLSILDAILRSTPDGYRQSDARFLAGAIYWRQRRIDAAVRSWRGMIVDPADSHVKTYSEVLRALERGAGAGNGDAGEVSSPLHREIGQILKNHHGRWVMSSYDRLRQFGYRFDTF
jgi:hypothetical protein